jgi:hypothetical protein
VTKKQEYFEFINDNFKGLVVAKGLFYNWNIGLRFDLQVGKTNTDEYFNQVAKRATTLFLETFDSTDSLYLVFIDFKYKRRKIRFSNYCFRQILQLSKTEIHYTKARQLYEPNDRLDIRNVAIIKLKTERINFRNILSAIAHSDFPKRQPRLDKNGVSTNKEVYFINTTKKIIFNMYDDRGLDILANDREILRPLYEKHKDWLDDYDLIEMEKRMK